MGFCHSGCRKPHTRNITHTLSSTSPREQTQRRIGVDSAASANHSFNHRNALLTGAATDASSSFEGFVPNVEPRVWLFVTHIAPHVTEEDMTTFITNRLENKNCMAKKYFLVIVILQRFDSSPSRSVSQMHLRIKHFHLQLCPAVSYTPNLSAVIKKSTIFLRHIPYTTHQYDYEITDRPEHSHTRREQPEHRTSYCFALRHSPNDHTLAASPE